MKKNDLILSDEVVNSVIKNYTAESGVRQLEQEIKGLIRNWVHSKVKTGKAPHRKLNAKIVRDVLGVPKRSDELLPERLLPGMSLGLAWTQAGGDVLLIEVNLSRGKGKLVLTGLMGDVMRESAQAALTFVKSRASSLGIHEDVFNENDIHLHIPSGAVPKDGPSAGVVLACAIVSAFTGRVFPRDAAITGEITLTAGYCRSAVFPKNLYLPKEMESKNMVPQGK
jgi:ATP-dependent Lon protease